MKLTSDLRFLVRSKAVIKPIAAMSRWRRSVDLKKFIAQAPAVNTPVIAQLLGFVDEIVNNPTGTIPTKSASRIAHFLSPDDEITNPTSTRDTAICKNRILKIEAFVLAETK